MPGANGSRLGSAHLGEVAVPEASFLHHVDTGPYTHSTRLKSSPSNHLPSANWASRTRGYKDWNDALQSDLDREFLKRRIIKAPKVEAPFGGTATRMVFVAP
jgi:hypothetical protein